MTLSYLNEISAHGKDLTGPSSTTDARFTHLVKYHCSLLQVDTKKWLERLEKKNKLHSKKTQNRKVALLWNIGDFVSTAESCINFVSAVKYSEKRKS